MGQGFSTRVQQSSDGCGNQGASLASEDRASTPQRAFSVFSLFLWLCCISQEQNLWKLILTPSSWSIWESLPRPSCHCARALWGVYLSTCFLIYSRAIVAASVKVQWSQPSNEEAANAAQCCLTWFPKREIICARVACCLMGISVWLFKEHTGLGNSAKARGECKAWLSKTLVLLKILYLYQWLFLVIGYFATQLISSTGNTKRADLILELW